MTVSLSFSQNIIFHLVKSFNNRHKVIQFSILEYLVYKIWYNLITPWENWSIILKLNVQHSFIVFWEKNWPHKYFENIRWIALIANLLFNSKHYKKRLNARCGILSYFLPLLYHLHLWCSNLCVLHFFRVREEEGKEKR